MDIILGTFIYMNIVDNRYNPPKKNNLCTVYTITASNYERHFSKPPVNLIELIDN